jgi:hypothetical protein
MNSNLRNTALLVFVLITSFASAQDKVSLSPPVFMPDGAEFLTWQNTTAFEKTYWVDQKHPKASDTNPGTQDLPFLTINRAARELDAGEQVLIRSGTYRELVEPGSGGTGPDRMISYQAAPGAQVIIKGSEILTAEWKGSLNPAQFSQKLWMTSLPQNLFERESPFQLENANEADIAIMPWATEWSGRVPYTLRRGLVFQDGRRMSQLASYEDLVRLPGSYWVEPSGTVLHIHPFDGKDPNEVQIEVTTRQQLLRPSVKDLGYIHIKGLTFMQAGNGFPRTGVGAVFTMGGHHWLIEDNVIQQVGSVGIEIGTRTIETANREKARADGERASKNPGSVIVRNNLISDCGTGGIQGLAVRHALVEYNHIFNCGWQDVERYWETGSIKLLINEETLVRRNLIHDMTGGPAIWLDWNNRNSRVTQNMAYDIFLCCNGALFVEASQVPNLIDNNILWNIQGTAVYLGDTDEATIAHNLIGPSTGTGVLSLVATQRSLNGRPLTSKRNRVVNNIIFPKVPISFADPENLSDFNMFSDPTGGFDLEKWQEKGWDTNSTTVRIDASLDREALILDWNPVALFSRVPSLKLQMRDFWDQERQEGRVVPGPFLESYSKQVPLVVRPVRP